VTVHAAARRPRAPDPAVVGFLIQVAQILGAMTAPRICEVRSESQKRRCGRLRRHAAALVRATLASDRAILAMGMLVPGALLAAGIAHGGAQLAELAVELTASRHVARRESADGGAVHVEGNALRHHLDVLLSQAGGGAVVAGIGTGVASLDAGLVDLMGHVGLR